MRRALTFDLPCLQVLITNLVRDSMLRVLRVYEVQQGWQPSDVASILVQGQQLYYRCAPWSAEAHSTPASCLTTRCRTSRLMAARGLASLQDASVRDADTLPSNQARR